MSSPMKPLVKILSILGFLVGSGVDFEKLQESDGLVFQRSKFWFIKLGLIFVLPVIASSFLVGYLIINELRLTSLLDNMRSSGLTTTDICGLELVIFVNLAVSAYLIKNCSQPKKLLNLTQLVKRLAHLINLLKIEFNQTEELASKSIKHALLSLALGLVSNVLSGFVIYGIYAVQMLSPWLSVTNGCLAALAGFFTLTSPASLINHLLCSQVLRTISYDAPSTRVIRPDGKFVNSKSVKSQMVLSCGSLEMELPSTSKLSPEFFICTGIRIVGCIKLANSVFGSIIFVEIGLSLFNLAINAYFICTIYVIFVEDSFPWVVLLFILANVAIFILAAHRIFCLTSASEDLGRELMLAKDCIQNYQASNFSSLKESEKFELECLRDQLSIETPMKPLSGFQLNFNTILTAIGLVATYTIVLLQFKIDEMKSPSAR